MRKRSAILGALIALTIWNPSNAAAQGWDGWGRGGCCGITVHIGFPNFCCDNRRFFPRRRFDCCDDRRFFPRRRVFCCDDGRFFRRPVFCCDDRRFFPSRFDCCEDRRFFGRRFWGDGGWDSDYTGDGYGYDE